MTGLVLKLKPNEKLLINGIVLQNGARRARIRIKSDGVSILRGRDALCPEDADTPLKRIYYLAQLALVGDLEPENARTRISSGLGELKSIFSGESALLIAKAQAGADEGKFYNVMRALRRLFPLEEALLKQPVAS